MGTVQVPEDAYYGAQTQRAAENFPISGIKMPLPFIHALALIKKCAAPVNAELGVIGEKIANAVEMAADDVLTGKFDDQFVVDLFQTGSGTSTNMNMNEVIASRANEILTGEKGGKSPVHPNDHVNTGQSSNDTVPSAIHIAALQEIEGKLLPALDGLYGALSLKARAFDWVKKIGRTHLQDAVPMTLGHEFSGYARQIELSIERIRSASPRLRELALGGTAVGTGINARPGFAEKVIKRIAIQTGIDFHEARNHFEAQAAKDAAVEMSGVLKTVAVSLTKIANDIRWLASGPRCGIGEIRIPPLQPGSSIMPGKVNPVIPEVVLQVCAQVVGNDAAITMGGMSGVFELNVMMPLIAHNLLQSIGLLSTACRTFEKKCIRGIEPDAAVSTGYIEKSLALATNLIPEIGYDKAAEVAKKAYETGRTVRRTVLEEKILDKETVERLLGKLSE